MAPESTADQVQKTPILDSGVLSKTVRRKRAVSTLMGVVAGGLFALVLIHSAETARGFGRNPATDYYTLFYLSILFSVVVVHEAGHLLAGWTVGFRFSSLGIGPLTLKIEHGLLKIRFRREVLAAGYAGMHLNGMRRVRQRLLVFIAGGPGANLLSAAVAAALDQSLTDIRNSWISIPLTLFAQFSLIVGLLNLIPFLSNALFSDGSRIRMLLGSYPKARRYIAVMAIAAQSESGIRPRKWRQTWLRAASSVHDDSLDDCANNWLAYASANDRKDAVVAALHLERCLELCPLLGPSAQDIILQEAGVFTAWFRRDGKTARTWFQQVKKAKALPELLRIRMDVAQYCGDAQFDDALTRLQAGFRYIQNLPESPQRDRLQEGWFEWRDEIQQRMNMDVNEPLVGATVAHLS